MKDNFYSEGALVTLLNASDHCTVVILNELSFTVFRTWPRSSSININVATIEYWNAAALVWSYCQLFSISIIGYLSNSKNDFYFYFIIWYWGKTRSFCILIGKLHGGMTIGKRRKISSLPLLFICVSKFRFKWPIAKTADFG